MCIYANHTRILYCFLVVKAKITLFKRKGNLYVILFLLQSVYEPLINAVAISGSLNFYLVGDGNYLKKNEYNYQGNYVIGVGYLNSVGYRGHRLDHSAILLSSGSDETGTNMGSINCHVKYFLPIPNILCVLTIEVTKQTWLISYHRRWCTSPSLKKQRQQQTRTIIIE